MIEKDSLNFKKIANHLYLKEVEQLLKLRIALYNKISIKGIEWEKQLKIFDLMKGFVYGDLPFNSLKEVIKEELKK
jgi:hypothetical protein